MPSPKYDTGMQKIRKVTKKPKPYEKKEPDPRGQMGREPHCVRSFWIEYNMDQVQAMSDAELMQAIDESLERYAERQRKVNKNWHWPHIKS